MSEKERSGMRQFEWKKIRSEGGKGTRTEKGVDEKGGKRGRKMRRRK